MTRAASAAAPSRIVAVVSDIHWPHPAPAWAAFRAWHRAVRPAWTIILGDAIDLAALSSHPKDGSEPQSILPEIQTLAREANALRDEAARVTFAPGNHERRFAKYLGGLAPHLLKGLKGLTLEDQLRAHGLRCDVEWFDEKVGAPGLRAGQFVLRHGDKQAGRFGGGVNVASVRLNKSLGQSEAFGHHHTGQVVARAAHGRTAVALANPCMSQMASYAGSDNTFVVGFTVLELRPPRHDHATPYMVLADERGGFAWGGAYYAPPARGGKP